MSADGAVSYSPLDYSSLCCKEYEKLVQQRKQASGHMCFALSLRWNAC